MNGKAPLFCSLLLAATGCSLIKINGKPLSEMRGSEQEEASSSSSGSSAAGAASAAPVTPIAKASPKSAMCKMSNGESEGTLAQLEDRLAKQEPEYAAATLVDALCTTEGEYAERRDEVKKAGEAWMASHSFDDRDVAFLYQKGRRPVADSQELSEFTGAVGEYAALEGQGDLGLAFDRLGKAEISELAKSRAAGFCQSAALLGGEAGPSLMLAVLCTRSPSICPRRWRRSTARKG